MLEYLGWLKGQALKQIGLVASSMLFCVIVIPVPMVHGQAVHDFGSWFSLNTQGKLNLCSEESKVRWWFDGHLRYLDDSGGFHQTIFRPALGYQLNPNTNVWAGYAWINELPTSGADIFDEHRSWQQLIWSRSLNSLSVMSRSRFEQRFVSTGDDTGLRFRQFLKADCPLTTGSPTSLVVWDEMFFDLNETDWGQQGTFSQNRLFVGLGRKFEGPNKPKIEIGYLNQFIRRTSGPDRMAHILSLNWFWTF